MDAQGRKKSTQFLTRWSLYSQEQSFGEGLEYHGRKGHFRSLSASMCPRHSSSGTILTVVSSPRATQEDISTSAEIWPVRRRSFSLSDWWTGRCDQGRFARHERALAFAACLEMTNTPLAQCWPGNFLGPGAIRRVTDLLLIANNQDSLGTIRIPGSYSAISG
jgi:hypothetical protein